MVLFVLVVLVAVVTIVPEEPVLFGVLSLAKTDSPWPISFVYNINVDDSVGNCFWHGVHFC